MKKGQLVVVAVVALMLVFSATQSFTEEGHEVVQNIADGSVDWSQGIITAVGIGSPSDKYRHLAQERPMALRAAKVVAQRNLLEVIKGVRVNSSTVVKNFIVESDVIRTQVEGMVQGAQVIKKEYLSDGTVEVTMAMKLHGGFAQLILPKDIKQVSEIKTIPPSTPALHPRRRKR
jgi:hypothetical protein